MYNMNTNQCFKFWKIFNLYRQDAILIINTGYLGDVIVTSKLIRDAKEYFKKNIVFMVDKPNKKLAEQIPNVDDILVIDRKNFKDIFYLASLIIRNRLKYKFEYAFITFTPKKWQYIIAKLLGVKSIKTWKNELSEELKEIEKTNIKYNLVHYKNANVLATVTNKLTDDRDIELKISKEIQEKIDEEIKKLNITNLVAINPQAQDEWKTWDINELKEFIKWLIENEYTPILTGVSKDGKEYIKILEDELKEKYNNKYINLYDKTSIEELSAWYKRSKALISVDTGSSHVGIAVGTPTVVLFFKDWAKNWRPINLNKNAYIEKEEILASDVIEKFKEIVIK